MSALQEIAIDIEADLAANSDDAGKTPHLSWSSLTNRIGDLSIGRKITLFFSLNLGFALIAGLAIVVAILEIGNRSEQILEYQHNAIVAERLVVELSEAQRHAEALANTADPVRASAALEELNRARGSLDKLNELARDPAMPYFDQISTIGRSVDSTRTTVEAYIAETKAGSQTASATLGESVVAGLTTVNSARALATQIKQDADRLAASNISLITVILCLWVGLASILILLTLLAQRYFDRHVGGSLSQLASQMTRLSSGEETPDFKTSNRGDEIGEMTRAMMVFHRASVRLDRLSRERSERAREQLEEQARLQAQKEEAQIERQRALHKIAEQFEHKVADVVTKVASASSQLQSTATSMAASAEQASTRTSEVTTSMQEANSGATAAAAASDEFALSIGEVSRQAASSAELARKATISTRDADATISNLSQSAEQVGAIVELIQTIAQRTNLLALNASIEAARGGQAGRGFAVVASEVKELAMQTSRATDQVAEQIRAMQETTGASVEALRSIGREVAELESTAVSIASAVDEQSLAGQDLARSIDMAARGTEEVSEHIKEVQELSISTGSAAAQVLSSATALEQQSATLRSQVNALLEEVRAS